MWLEGSRAKLQRGESHLETFRRDEIEFVTGPESPRVTAVQYLDFQTRRCVVELDRVDEVPLAFGVLIGDALHNFRSALDHLVFELAFLDSRGTEFDKTAFPCSPSRSNFNGPYVQDTLLAGVTKTHKALFRRFQPYRGWDGVGPHPLSLLNDLSNDDKHRLVQPNLAAATEFECKFSSQGTDCMIDASRPFTGENVIGRPLEPKTQLLTIPLIITGPNPRMNVKCEAEIEIAFGNGLTATKVLADIAKCVSGIIEFFAPIFDTRTAHRLALQPRRGRMESPVAGTTFSVNIAGPRFETQIRDGMAAAEVVFSDEDRQAGP